MSPALSPGAAPSPAESASGYSPLARVLARVLDPLPYPRGEDVMAALGLAHTVVHPARLRRVRAWARAQTGAAGQRRGLVRSIFAHYGRFVAQDALVGVRSADDLRRGSRVEGMERVAAARRAGGVILLGFHLGPPGAWLVLQLAGCRVTFFGDARHRRRWLRAARRACLDPGGYAGIDGASPGGRLRALGHAARLLRAGEVAYVVADGPYGREAFRLELPGGPLRVRSGWLALRRHTGAVTLPVLAHQEGRQRVVVVHPPLPPARPAAALDAAACRDALAPLVAAYLARVPEQCVGLALRDW